MKTFWRGTAGTSAAKTDRGSTSPTPAVLEPPPSAVIPRIAPLARLVDSERFQIFIAGVIIINAVVIALSTYQSIEDEYGQALTILNDALYGIFLLELIIRLVSYMPRPWNFFRSGWNIFDFIVIGAVLIPAVRQQVTILRLLRLARIVRLMRFLPDARVLLLTVTRATPAVVSMVVLTILVIFVYAVIGWSLFGQELPNEWGDIGTAMLTLFILLTLENFPVYLHEAQEVSAIAPLYFLSFVLIAAFIIVNLLIGVIISAMDQARSEEAQRSRKSDSEKLQLLVTRVQEMHDVLDEIQSELEDADRDLTSRSESKK
jgi:voltage-gated sodium channel